MRNSEPFKKTLEVDIGRNIISGLTDMRLETDGLVGLTKFRSGGIDVIFHNLTYTELKCLRDALNSYMILQRSEDEDILRREEAEARG